MLYKLFIKIVYVVALVIALALTLVNIGCIKFNEFRTR